MSAIARRCITPESHRRFAEFSGDLNPLHVDAAAARAMEPGGQLAYGMDLVLWTLQSLAERNQLPAQVARIRARFLKWVFLGEEVDLTPADNTRSSAARFDLTASGATVATLELFAGERLPSQPVKPSRPQPRREQARDVGIEQLEGQEGDAALAALADARRLYPDLAETFGAAAIAELAGCSYIIGMEAPGLYSMSMRYDLALTGAEGSSGAWLRYRVSAVDSRFRKATVEVSGGHIAGTLEAFVRKQ